MAKNRAAATARLLELMTEFDPSGKNTQIYKDMLEGMDDSEFDEFMESLRGDCLRVINPNGGGVQITTENNFRVAKLIGVKLHQKVWVPDRPGVRGYLTPNEYLVLELFVRRQAQVLVKKISTAEDSHVVDNLTGQVTSDSRASGLSFPEMSVMESMGLTECLSEIMKYRGGDDKGLTAMKTVLARTGEVELKAIEPYASGVKSTKTLAQLLNAAHLSNTLSR